jgi:hypothetical protein
MRTFYEHDEDANSISFLDIYRKTFLHVGTYVSKYICMYVKYGLGDVVQKVDFRLFTFHTL